MGIAAVPHYLGQDFSTAPPGHRFGLYFPYWQFGNWEADDKQKTAALKGMIRLAPDCQKQLKALRERQAALAEQYGEMVLALEAISSAPFMTGTGIEHPLENGFAFLNPYGLPYLPGSGVKGVLRQAAEQLISEDYGDTQGWDQKAINALFGPKVALGDTETAHQRGALAFWDAIPQPAGNTLHIEVMTPHYSDYYQGASTPHDSGQPNPIPFLAIPPNSAFIFYVQCHPVLLPESGHVHWQELMGAAFAHAFDWLGFGAKTAVGYGAMRRNLEQEQKSRHDAAEPQRRVIEANLPVEQKAIAKLRNWFDEDQAAKRKEPGGRVAHRLSELLKEGLVWPKNERETLAVLAETIYGYLDWGNSKRKQERKTKIQQLRQGQPD